MQHSSKYLVVIDPTSEVQPALHRAEVLARATGASLELMVCFYNEYLAGDRLFDSPSLRRAREELLDGYRRRLEEMAEPARKTGTLVTTAATFDHPLSEGIVRHAIECGATMVFKDTHHHSAISRALLTNTDWNLIRTCPAPLWLVKPRDIASQPTLIASIDPMNHNDKPAALDDEIIQLGKNLGQALNGNVHAFHAYDPRIAVATATANAYIPVSLPLDEIEHQMHDDHKKRFDEITTFHELPDANTHLVAGLTHEELPDLANELGADVVIMGAVARNALKRLFIGATAERTLEHLPCDLLIVKPDWFRTPVQVHAHEAA